MHTRDQCLSRVCKTFKWTGKLTQIDLQAAFNHIVLQSSANWVHYGLSLCGNFHPFNEHVHMHAQEMMK